MGIVNNILAGASGQQGYLIANSLRFQSASTQYLSRTPASNSTSQTTRTFSAWIKRGALASAGRMNIFYQGVSAGTGQLFQIEFINDSIRLYYDGGATYLLTTSAVFRDVSAWYHIIVVSDTTQATASDRTKIYVNGTLQTITGTQPPQNYTAVNGTTSVNYVGGLTTLYLFDGYMAEVNFIDGQALTPSSFGETDALTGVWVAKRYTGTYGTNGFYLKFNDGTSTTTLGQDRSGNGNNWTLTNFTRSAGVSDCWMLDVPSGNGSPSATQPSSNYCVLNSLSPTSVTVSNGNLQATYASTWKTVITTMQIPTTGKWYWECTATSIGTPSSQIGIASSSTPLTTYFSFYAGGYAYQNNATKMNNNSGVSYGATYATNDVIGVAFNADTLDLTFYKNGVSQGSAYTVTAGEYFAAIALNGATAAVAANFGQRSFAYTPPSGFKALCTANLPAPTIAKGNQYMDATLWTGDNANPRAITNAAGFQPDLVWIKSRSNAQQHVLNDSVRGTGTSKGLSSNTTDAEGSANILLYGAVTAFNSNGFSVGGGTSNQAFVNFSPYTYVGWQWNAGGSTVTNTSGSISSQVRANTTAGFSIVTYTTPTSGTGTIGHGLGIAPSMIITKNINGTIGWNVYHKSLGNTQYVLLNSTAASATLSTLWNSTSPTSSVFSIGTSFANTGTYVAYCFAEIAGFSRFGSYTGNGSTDGPMVYLGFQPKYWLVKRTDGADDWFVFDSAREPSNSLDLRLCPNGAFAEASTTTGFDFLANGVKVRSSSAAFNASGGTYIYMAFASNPFAQSNSF